MNRTGDVTAQRRLPAQEDRFRWAALASGDAIYDWDVRAGSVWRNEAYEARYAPSRPIAAAAAWWEPPIHPADRDAIVRSVADAVEGRLSSWSGEYRVLGLDGAYASVNDRGSILYGADGRACRMVGVLRDVTARKRDEAAYRELLEDSLQGVFLLQDLRIVFANRSATEILGFSAEEMLGFSHERLLELIRPEDRHHLEERIYERSPGGELPSARFEYRILRSDGTARWIDVATAWIEFQGRPTLRISLVDVTDRKRAGEEHREHLWLLECMDRINRAIQGARELEQMMSDVLDEVLAIFDCDRVWLTYPCDPSAPSFRVPMERTRPEYPGALALDLEVPMDEFSARTCQGLLDASGPVPTEPGGDGPLSEEWGERFSIRSQLAMAIRPKNDNAYAFGMHQCSRPRVWTPLEQRAFLEIGRRLADGLSSLLAHRNLTESEAKLAEAERISHVGYWELDAETGRISWSDEGYRIVGLEPQESPIDVERFRKMVHPEDLDGANAALAVALQGGPRFDGQFRVIRTDGEVRWAHSQGDLRIDGAGRRRMFGTVQDVTERNRAEQALRDNQNFLRAIIDHSSAVIYVKDLQSRYLLVNRHFESLFRLDRDAAIGRTDDDFLDAERAAASRASDRRVVASGEALEFEDTVPQDDGLHTYLSSKSPLLDADGRTCGVCGISTDITERKRIEEQTRISLREKEALLKEVHHRVKNNLQIISSLLTLQSRHVADPTAREVLAESQGRVRSMALVHEALYRSPSLANVGIAPYIESLCAHLYRSYGIDSRRIGLSITVPELTLDLDRAIPCGLLINELVSNALKHAFLGDRPGSISVEFLADDAGAYRLVVADDGVGLPPDLDVSDAPSLGLQLVSSLTEQLRGRLDVDSAPEGGTRISISFTK